MAHVNIEIKARCDNPQPIRALLAGEGAEFRGVDWQVDSYFAVANGRLKLRQGTIENSLIYYQRPDQEGPKQSEVILIPQPDAALVALLRQALGVRVEVRKRREIYFIGNVKFHLDEVDGLGGFVEIEAIDAEGSIGVETLQKQCRHYMDLLGIGENDLESHSYSDLLRRTT